MKVIPIFALKGGVGKSTSVKWISYLLSKKGSVLVLDFCRNSSFT
jgi:cellulose biosynthesis protein BcsQ